MLILSDFKQACITYNKTGVERRQTLGPLRSINPNMINHFIKQSPLLFSKSYTQYRYVLSVHESIYKESTKDCQIDVSHLCWLSLVVVDTTWFGRLSNIAHR